MTRILTLAVVVLVGVAAGAGAQPPASSRVIGDVVSGQMSMNAATGDQIDTATLGFKGADGSPSISIDFVARYRTGSGGRAPAVVDVVVTHHPAGDDHPEVSLRVDGEPLPVVARARTPRAIVTTIAFDEFVRIANADAVTERAFDVDLEFGPAQRAMLRATAGRWAGAASR